MKRQIVLATAIIVLLSLSITCVAADESEAYDASQLDPTKGAAYIVERDQYLPGIYNALYVASMNDGGTIVMLKDSQLTRVVTFEKDVDVTIDLNGHTINMGGLYVKMTTGSLTFTGNGSIVQGNLGVANSGPVVIDPVAGSSVHLTVDSGVSMTGKNPISVQSLNGNGNADGVVIDVKGKVTGEDETGFGFGIYVNGAITQTDGNPVKVNVYEGAEITAPVAMYLAGVNETTITGGNISGNTGIEIRNGSLTVSGENTTITSTATSYETASTPSGGGSTVSGAAVAVSPNSSAAELDIDISGGSLTGQVAFAEVNADNIDLPEIGLAISGGIFTSNGTYVEEETQQTKTYSAIVANPGEVPDKFVKGGSFNSGDAKDETVMEYVPDGFDMGEDGQISANLVATIEGKDYYTFQDAVDAAKTSDGKGFSLLTDLELTGIGVIDVSGITIDLNDHKISADNFSLIFEGSDFTLKNGSFSANGGAYGIFIGDNPTENVLLDDLVVDGGVNVFNSKNVVLRNMDVSGTIYYAVWCDEGGNVTIESGTYDTSASYVVGLTDNGSSMSITGGTFNVASGQGLVLPSSASEKRNEPVITGGTFTGVSSDDISKFLPEGYVMGDNGTVEESPDAEFVVNVGDVGYTSFEEAVSAAGEGATITLLDNVTTGYVNITKGLDIDLGGYTLTIGDTGNSTIGLDFGAGESTIRNGTVIDARSNGTDRNTLYAIYSYGSSDLTVDCKVMSYSPDSIDAGDYNYCTAVQNAGAKLTLGPNAYLGELEQQGYENGDVGVVGVSVLGANSSTGSPSILVVKDGAEIHVSGMAISGNGSDGNRNTDITIEGGVIESSGTSAIYLPQQLGVFTITGNPTITGVTGIEIRSGSLIITGNPTITATGEFSNNPNSNGQTTSGAAIAVCQHTTKQPITVDIRGGTFNGAYGLFEANPQQSPAPSLEDIHIKISGGTFTGSKASVLINDFEQMTETQITGGNFNSDVSAYCPEGSVPFLKDGKYVVSDGWVVTFDVNGTQTKVNVADGQPVPSASVPKLPTEAGFEYAWTVGGSGWVSDSAITGTITITAVKSLVFTVSIEVGDDARTLTAKPVCAADGVQYVYVWYKDGAAIVDAMGASIVADGPGVYSVSATGTAGGISAVVSAQVSYRPGIIVEPEQPVPEYDINHDGDDVSAEVDGDTVIVTSSGEHDNIDFEIGFTNEGQTVASVAINGSVSHGAVTVKVEPIAVEDLISYAEGLDHHGLGGVDVSLKNIAGIDMVIKVPFESDGTQYVGDADAYYIEDGKLIPVMCRVMGEEVWVYTDHNTPYMVVVTEIASEPQYEPDPTVQPEPEPDRPVINPGWDDDDYVPLPPHIVYEDEPDDNTTEIVACAAAAVVAALMAAFLIIERRRN